MKTKKGMTLVEIVISLGIYALLALLLTEIMSVVNSTMRATNQLNDRLSYQSKFADNMITSGATEIAGTMEFTMNYGHVVDADGTLDDSGGSIARDSVGNPLEFHEWVIGAPRDADGNLREVAGINFAQDINYKFVTYEYPSEDNLELDDHGFRVRVLLLPYVDDGTLTDAQKSQAVTAAENWIKDVDKIVVEGQILDPDADNANTPHPLEGNTHELWSATNSEQKFSDLSSDQKKAYVHLSGGAGDVQTGNWIEFEIENQAGTVTDDVDTVMNDHNEIVIRFYDDRDRQVLAFRLPEMYMYVKNGSTRTFYEQTMVALDMHLALSTRREDYENALRLGKSKSDKGADYTMSEFLLREDDEPTPEEPGGETPEEPGEETPEG